MICTHPLASAHGHCGLMVTPPRCAPPHLLPQLPHGLVFAGFMICVMIGSRTFSTIIGTAPVESTLRTVFLVATFSLAIPVLMPVGTQFSTHHVCGMVGGGGGGGAAPCQDVVARDTGGHTRAEAELPQRKYT